MCFSLFILPDQIWSLQSCSVPVDNGRDYMLPVKSNEPLMKLILGTRSQNIEVMDPHPSIGRQQLVPQTRFSLLNLLQDVIFQHKGICMAYLYLHTGICMTYFIMQSGICHVYANLWSFILSLRERQVPKSLSYPRDIIHCADWHICAISISSEWYMSTICAPYLYLHTGICMTYYICRVVYVMYRVVYVIYMPRADLRFAALSRLAVAMKQSLSLRCDLLVNLLRITHRERLLCIIQLVARTPARGTLHCRTHSSV